MLWPSGKEDSLPSSKAENTLPADNLQNIIPQVYHLGCNIVNLICFQYNFQEKKFVAGCRTRKEKEKTFEATQRYGTLEINVIGNSLMGKVQIKKVEI